MKSYFALILLLFSGCGVNTDDWVVSDTKYFTFRHPKEMRIYKIKYNERTEGKGSVHIADLIIQFDIHLNKNRMGFCTDYSEDFIAENGEIRKIQNHEMRLMILPTQTKNLYWSELCVDMQHSFIVFNTSYSRAKEVAEILFSIRVKED